MHWLFGAKQVFLESWKDKYVTLRKLIQVVDMNGTRKIIRESRELAAIEGLEGGSCQWKNDW